MLDIKQFVTVFYSSLQFIAPGQITDFPETLKYWVGIQWGQSYLRGEGSSLALVRHPYSDGIMIKIPYGVDILLHNHPHAPSFPVGLVKLNLILMLDQFRLA